MIKIKIKNKIKNILGKKWSKKLSLLKYKTYNLLCSIFPMKDEIIFESHPDFSCNAYEVYRYFVERNINSKFKLTWLVDGTVEPRISGHNIGFLNMYPKGIFEKTKYYVRCNRARVVIASNRHIPKFKVSKDQLNIYLDHGSQLKSMLQADKSRFELSCDYLMCQSEFFVPYCLEQYTLNKEQIICTGLPRNDQIFAHHDTLKDLIPYFSDFSKVIIWTPTFRQHKRTTRVDCKRIYPLGLPILNSLQDASCLNEVLSQNKVLLLIKPHPTQRLEVIKKQNLSNIRFLYNVDMHEHDIQLNELLEQMDAMVTDYSSIYYDYLLTHRPIGITLDDYDDYYRDKGFVFVNPLDILKGEYIYSLEDFCSFVCNVANSIDREKESRERICDRVHMFQDDKSAERVYNFINSKMKGKLMS